MAELDTLWTNTDTTRMQIKRPPMLQASGLHKQYGGLLATHNVSLELYRGEILALIGPNGAGKTTVLGQLSGALKPDSGIIRYIDRDITRLAMPERARRGIARSYQISATFLEFTVFENVAIAVQAGERLQFRPFADVRRAKTINTAVWPLLERTGLQAMAGTPAANLAHGQRRQLEIAMVLATRPQVLLLDEPMAGMGAAEAQAMGHLIEQLRPDHAILLVEHDMDMVFRLADRIAVLVDGEIIATGPPDTIRRDARVQAAYLEDPGAAD